MDRVYCCRLLSLMVLCVVVVEVSDVVLLFCCAVCSVWLSVGDCYNRCNPLPGDERVSCCLLDSMRSKECSRRLGET